jgi:isocitrate dehydrogenase
MSAFLPASSLGRSAECFLRSENMVATTRSLADWTAGDLMSRNVISVSCETPLCEAGRLLLLHQISGLPVVEPGGTCVGVLSAIDLLRRQIMSEDQLPTETVEQFMTPDPVTVIADTPLPELARRMVDAHVHRVVVVDRRQRPVGLVSSTDILAGIAGVTGGSV